MEVKMEYLEGEVKSTRAKKVEVTDEFIDRSKSKMASWSIGNTFLTVISLMVLVVLNGANSFSNLRLRDFLIIGVAFLFSSWATFKIIKTANSLPDKGRNMYPVAPNYFYQGTIFCALVWLAAGIFALGALS
jgi:hypothetical protein